MSAPNGCNPCCSTTTTTQIPGPAGTDATIIPADTVDPNGNKTATVAGQTYTNISNPVAPTYWVATAVGNASWTKLLGLFAILLFSMSAMAQPILRGPLTTNTPTASLVIVSNIADARIAVDTTKQPASAILSTYAANPGLSTNDALNLTNIQPSAFVGMKFTGVTSSRSTLMTNYLAITNGIICTNWTYP